MNKSLIKILFLTIGLTVTVPLLGAEETEARLKQHNVRYEQAQKPVKKDKKAKKEEIAKFQEMINLYFRNDYFMSNVKSFDVKQANQAGAVGVQVNNGKRRAYALLGTKRLAVKSEVQQTGEDLTNIVNTTSVMYSGRHGRLALGMGQARNLKRFEGAAITQIKTIAVAQVSGMYDLVNESYAFNARLAAGAKYNTTDIDAVNSNVKNFVPKVSGWLVADYSKAGNANSSWETLLAAGNIKLSKKSQISLGGSYRAIEAGQNRFAHLTVNITGNFSKVRCSTSYTIKDLNGAGISTWNGALTVLLGPGTLAANATHATGTPFNKWRVAYTISKSF